MTTMATHTSEGAILIASRLSKRYGQTTALRQVSISLRASEFLVITGPSGSGKSTLLHCLAGILLPDEGFVYFQGQNLRQLDDDARTTLRRKHFGFVFQFPVFVPELSVLDNVALPLILDGWQFKPAKETAYEWLVRLKADQLALRSPSELSGGQQQLLAIARALVRDPQIVFADEPTGSLDSRSGERVLHWLHRAATQAGAAVIVVSHAAAVGKWASRHLFLKDGRIECGTE